MLLPGAVSAALGLVPPAGADPATDQLRQYQDLSNQLEQTSEQLLDAREQLKSWQAEVDRANTDLAQARQAEDRARAAQEAFRGQVDRLTEASFEGARLQQLSALLTSDSARDFLARSAAIALLARDNKDAMDRLSAAADQAADARGRDEDARNRAEQASAAAARLIAGIEQRQRDLQAQILAVRVALGRLAGPVRAGLISVGDIPVVTAPAGAAGAAVMFALDQLGKPYVSGATGPNAYDCSGLTWAAYRSAGVVLPRTAAAQSGVGIPVSRDDVRAGDLIFYYSPVHHVAIAIDHYRAVHASTEGVPIKVASIDSIGPRSAIRRISE
ncbi:C40 family peptidase [Gandjariella thermophila]|uniref:C40 family peptidase n=1 Tax=Gandjariella thermophila TaxID=1931992 RepID=UPI001CEF974F|nr:C40 family peptidase [Gandjariella thermophila]